MFKRFAVVLICLCSLVFGLDDIDWLELRGRWTFDEGTGTSTEDVTVRHNDGTLHDVQWVKGIRGNALRFNGTSSYIDCGNDASLDLYGYQSYAGAVTTMAWFFLEEPFPTSTYQSIIQNGDSYRMMLVDNPMTPHNGVVMQGLGVNKNVGFGQWNVNASTYFETGRWYHIAAVYGGNGGRSCGIYVNGQSVPRSGGDFPDVSIEPSDYSFRIGNQGAPPYGESNWFRGILDDVRVFARRVGPDEIWAMYSEFIATTDIQTIPNHRYTVNVRHSSVPYNLLGQQIQRAFNGVSINRNQKILIIREEF